MDKEISMCYAILRISYKNSRQSPILKEVKEEKDLQEEIDKIMERDKVQSIGTYTLSETTTLVNEWRVS